MLDFLHEVKPAGYVSYFLNPNSRPRYNNFTLIKESERGILFKDIVYTRDDTPYFHVSKYYLNDPDEWERELLELMQSDREKAVAGVLEHFGDVSVDEFTVDVVRVDSDGSEATHLKVRLHPGMKTPGSSKLAEVLACKGILAVPSLKFPV